MCVKDKCGDVCAPSEKSQNWMQYSEKVDVGNLLLMFYICFPRNYGSGHLLEELIQSSFERMSSELERMERETRPIDPMEYMTLLEYNFISNMTLNKK